MSAIIIGRSARREKSVYKSVYVYRFSREDEENAGRAILGARRYNVIIIHQLGH